MPTHRDAPRERDRTLPRPAVARGGSWVAGAAVVAAVAMGVTATRRTPVAKPPATAAVPIATLRPAPGSQDAAAGVGASVTRLRSRFVGLHTLVIWGETTAPDGASVRMSVTSPHVQPVVLPDVPAVGGRFYTQAELPLEMEGRRVMIRAGVAREG